MKDNIAQTALSEMMRRGLKFSIRDIAGQLGISTKTVYQYFESKEQIIGYIVEQSIADMKQAEMEVYRDSSLSIQQKLKKMLVLLPRGVFIDVRLLQELKLRYPEQWKEVDHHINHGWDKIRQLAKMGVDSGDYRPFDMELLIQMYVGALHRLMDDEVKDGKELPLEKALGNMVDILLEGIVSRR
ncbi:TetR/AcrR family transcriptional regulator [Paenibacillus nanensis]|uniref:TetR/AcrR family transcriptional regulator n=1 Tax=Paenibacillus nanensis TaxID=393251 RepID=A0A3A1VIE3_9BACL|nr:TetR/AcrR family transcriptional regulator [Paenibacillus nanensis]RIX60074.1 TetR/AcrR family transcriptional regulator [Paenibacillus nanensis]